ncbi:MAG: tRNA 2-thiouridine(34) synthase MnmA [Bacteroidales bacterium]|nr:MAG: tRNA 2-thiouridine(34) synthase MnmA [Bacteroidales bacterium]
MSKRVVVGISGGVDSSVAAYLLKNQGYDVTALFMINWHDTTGTLAGDCPWKDDIIFAELTAKKIGIPFHTVDFSEQYRQRVVDYMFSEYEKGRTPNPDVLCNREIKFDLFIKAALEYEADFVATGHYCKKEEFRKDGKTIYRLLAGDDKNKEQSYFLCQLSQEQLKLALFPVGHLNKTEVRKIAREQKLSTAEKKDSQGICFVGKVDLPAFLQQKLESRTGDIIEIPGNLTIYTDYKKISEDGDLSTARLKEVTQCFSYSQSDGMVVGKHQGSHYFTIGQNKGLNIGGRPEQSFVIALDVKNNIVYTGQGQNHPGLYRKGLFIPVKDIHWLRKDLKLKPGESKSYHARIRYRQPLQEATLFMKEEGLYIVFNKLQRGITSGQFAAWYDGNELVGSGVIY